MGLVYCHAPRVGHPFLFVECEENCETCNDEGGCRNCNTYYWVEGTQCLGK
jgi:hypothetical protein